MSRAAHNGASACLQVVARQHRLAPLEQRCPTRGLQRLHSLSSQGVPKEPARESMRCRHLGRPEQARCHGCSHLT